MNKPPPSPLLSIVLIGEAITSHRGREKSGSHGGGEDDALSSTLCGDGVSSWGYSRALSSFPR